MVSAQFKYFAESFFLSFLCNYFFSFNMVAMLDYAPAYKVSVYYMFMAVTDGYQRRIGHRSA